MTGNIPQQLAPLLGPLTDQEARWLQGRIRSGHYAPGHAVVRQGWPPRTMFLLLSGRVRASTTRTDGGQEVIAYVRPVSLFGHVSVIGRENYLATMTAVEPCECLLIPSTLLTPPADGIGRRLTLRLLEATILGMNTALRTVNARLLTMTSTDDLVDAMATDLGSWCLPEG